ncbi:PP2C family protein-serine/threonine phosphatase [Nocardioides marmotae]|uniref:PP2C family protein-serine/threonine phosphatase n=1 Tax=Nocardioides marmotae TaxID=2663857 RepID=UPI0012B677A3|nr:PP2C family protein-serine/threonine phosphatase [Nocardioides marmotae]MBC9733650.1 serine/threonine-protein phosphatase [Nocardioides marmotae]MTB84753.1 SpoIIE family protein phosphatase [Nocardioides marmotae]
MHETPALDVRALLEAVENASPAAAVTTAAQHLEDAVGARQVAFWIADAAGQALLRIPDGERLEVEKSPAGTAWREQRVEWDGSWWVPVTVRGDAQGVLEIRFHTDPPTADISDGVLEHLQTVAHLLGYVLVASQRHTDEYETGRRSTSFELAMEIQRRLLPQAFVCEGGSFTLAGWLEPSSSAGGDTFDYIASRDRLTVSLIDAVGHHVNAALLATLTVNAMRKARRDDGDLRSQAHAADAALMRHARPEEYATGVILELPLGDEPARAGSGSETLLVRVVNAGHPPIRLVRDGTVTTVDIAPDPPFGLDLGRAEKGFTCHPLELRAGDRLVLLTDGMYEQSAATFDLDDHIARTSDLHPRNAAQDIALAFREHVDGQPEDDATFVILDWHGGTTSRDTAGGSDLT